LAKVMIVDDDRITVTLLQTLLSLDGFEVVVVSRGGEVLAAAQRERPDIFMIDYNLIDITGIQVIKELRAQTEFAKTPILMVSGMNVEDEALKVGASVFLVKPFEPAKLAGLFTQLLSGR